jgi:hypothetical protein
MFPIFNLNKYYNIFDIYSIDDLLFWKYKYRFEFFNKKLDIYNFNNYNIFGSGVPININNCNFYPIEKDYITIYK